MKKVGAGSGYVVGLVYEFLVPLLTSLDFVFSQACQNEFDVHNLRQFKRLQISLGDTKWNWDLMKNFLVILLEERNSHPQSKVDRLVHQV